MKFSIIVPVYNVEKYLSKCLDSILSQTYNNYEIIIVNDGSTDNSQTIIYNYLNKYPNIIKNFNKANGGLSDARNFGVSKASGEYLLFIDSDDYIDFHLLEELAKQVNPNTPDVIGFSMLAVDDSDNIVGKIEKPEFFNLSGEEALCTLINSKKYFEAACFYCYNKHFWDMNNFQYTEGLYHEDFGLTPLILLKASKVTCINFFGYYYFQSPNSITRDINNLEKEIKKADDLLKHFNNIQKALVYINYLVLLILPLNITMLKN